MIYRHYKGGLYFLNGYATPFSNIFYSTAKVTIGSTIVAKYEKTMEDIKVMLIHDEGVNGTYYAYDNRNLSGVMCLYHDLNGQYWLRDRDDFYQSVEITGEDNEVLTTPRFERVNGEHLFDTISEMVSEHHKT